MKVWVQSFEIVDKYHYDLKLQDFLDKNRSKYAERCNEIPKKLSVIISDGIVMYSEV